MHKLLCACALTSVLTFSASAFAAETTADIVKASYKLSSGAGNEVRKTMNEADEENRQNTKQISKVRSELYTILGASTFDRKAFYEKAEEIRKLESQSRENQDDALAAAAVQLSTQDRKVLAQILKGHTGKGSQHVAAKGSRFVEPVDDADLAPSAGGN